VLSTLFYLQFDLNKYGYNPQDVADIIQGVYPENQSLLDL